MWNGEDSRVVRHKNAEVVLESRSGGVVYWHMIESPLLAAWWQDCIIL